MSLSTRTLGQHGPDVSIVGLGCNNFGRPGTASEERAGTDAVIGAAIDAGITLFDTADIYTDGQSETLMGECLKGGRRDRIVLATKFGSQGRTAPGAEDWGPKGAAGYITKACEASLRRLQTDHIDLYQIHTPDPSTPIEETLEALDGLVRSGKVRHLGHSNFDAEQVREADDVARERGLTPFVSAQNHYSLLARDLEASDLPAMAERGLGLLPYFPLASGLLTGKYRRDSFPEGARLSQREGLQESTNWDQLESYTALCEQHGVAPVEAAIGWLLSRPCVASVISGATTPEQVRANAAAGRRSLDADFLSAVDALFA